MTVSGMFVVVEEAIPAAEHELLEVVRGLKRLRALESYVPLFVTALKAVQHVQQQSAGALTADSASQVVSNHLTPGAPDAAPLSAAAPTADTSSTPPAPTPDTSSPAAGTDQPPPSAPTYAAPAPEEEIEEVDVELEMHTRSHPRHPRNRR